MCDLEQDWGLVPKASLKDIEELRKVLERYSDRFTFEHVEEWNSVRISYRAPNGWQMHLHIQPSLISRCESAARIVIENIEHEFYKQIVSGDCPSLFESGRIYITRDEFRRSLWKQGFNGKEGNSESA